MRPTMIPLDVVPEYPLDNDDDDGRAFPDYTCGCPQEKEGVGEGFSRRKG